MRLQFFIALLLTVSVTGVFLYQTALAVCPVPLAYSIGELDPRFDLAEAEAISALASAEAIWEEDLAMELFVYDPAAEFTVNFIFDERQALTEAEELFAEQLAQSQNASDAFSNMYDEMVVSYERAIGLYEAEVSVYQKEQAVYNTRVENFDEAGGAPLAAFASLKRERERLNRVAEKLSVTLDQLQEKEQEINQFTEQGNATIEKFNTRVEQYNQNFTHSREFTQGDYQRGIISIYTFSTRDELVAVLTHEFGHALSLDHVENEASMMYYLMEDQPDTLTLSSEDRAEFAAVCGDGSTWGRVSRYFRR